jgi:hypothetical protein
VTDADRERRHRGNNPDSSDAANGGRPVSIRML